MKSIVPKIFNDELFSSWLIRTAHRYGCDPIVITGHMWPKWRAWTIDIDRNLDDDKLNSLSKFSGKNINYFQKSFLFNFAKVISKEPHKKANWAWITPYGTRNRKHKGGLLFCPICLKSDKSPYYRRHWRFAWQTCCETHKVRLLDRCPNCEAVPQPHRIEAINGSIKNCFNCQFDLGSSKTFLIEINALFIQKECNTVLNTGISSFGELDSVQFYEVLRVLISVFNKCTLAKSTQLSMFIESYGITLRKINPSLTGSPFDLLPVNERTKVLSSIWKIIECGPVVLKDKLNEYEIPVTSLICIIDPLPKIILDIYGIDEMPKKRKRKLPLIDEFSPNSKKSVLRMYERLKKKLTELIIW
jgi:hypothetical protein